MNTVAAISSGLPARKTAGVTDAEARVEEMLLRLEDDALSHRIALRVQEVGASSQPLARIDVTDLALMIVSGNAMSRARDAVAAGSPVPPPYRSGF
ncbi:hypothetical protein [Oricola cellulosilytica]|uniref:Uncharacterized protein n=1 Tax=Oricola cellulosilytica TaxID=1429082 RepID=A0A4R0PCB4_9HYPH|nr:hypothetical protein [Oricola cellulosilytica]TCD14916.1 hypothetical protein E0D97_05000 [Oricola cellulosilytica]